MKVLVTGATGNVGQYVVSELLAMDEEVVVASRHPSKLSERFGKDCQIVHLDFTKPETFKEALEGVDRIFLVRPPHLGKPEDLYPFLDALRETKPKLLAFLSLMGIENNPIPPHHKIEKYIEHLGLPYAHIRPGFFMQNLSGIHALEIKQNNEIFVPAGRSKTSFIDAADIGLAIATVLHRPDLYKCTTHTITGPEALNYYQIAEILSEVTGRVIRYKKPGFLKYRSYYINTRGLNKAYVNVTVMLYLMTRLGSAKKVTTCFEDLTGQQPRSFKSFATLHRTAFE